MKQSDPRAVLERLARERGDDFTGLSRLIGRNASYIQQFIKRGTPKALAERDRRTLARYYDIEEAMLGAPPDMERKNLSLTKADGLFPVPRYAVQASAGPGSLAGEEEQLSALGFPLPWLRKHAGDPAALSIIAVSGDSMEPTLAGGDHILVHSGDAAERLRDGIYVLRQDDALVVKRIAINPANGRFTIKSDNAGYPDWPDCGPGDVDVIGRVVWAARKVV